MKIYHGTSAEHLAAILRDGIKPSGMLPTASWSGHRDLTFLTTTFPFLYALPTASRFGNLLIIEIDLNALEQEKLYPDPELFAHFKTPDGTFDLEKIPFAYQEYWTDSLNELGSVAYHGIIPPSAFTRYVSIDGNVRDDLVSFLGSAFPITLGHYATFGTLYREMTAWVFGDIPTVSQESIVDFTRAVSVFSTQETERRDGITVHDL